MFGEDQGRNDPVRDAMLIQMRGFALDRLGDLDCANSDLTLASCDPSVPPPTEVAARQKSLEAASVDDEAYATALAKVLRGLVCSRGEETINVVRGVGFQLRLSEAGTAAIDLIDDLTSKDSKDCPVSASLTDADKARLLQIKRDAIKEAGQ